jgi:hypothetical protein
MNISFLGCHLNSYGFLSVVFPSNLTLIEKQTKIEQDFQSSTLGA